MKQKLEQEIELHENRVLSEGRSLSGWSSWGVSGFSTLNRWLLVSLVASPAFAQNATVTANLKQLLGSSSQPSSSSIRVDLQNCSAPRVPGTGNIVEKSHTFFPNTSGVAAVTLFSNGVLDCGAGVPSDPTKPPSFYTFNLVSNGQVTSLGSYKVVPGAYTLDSLPPMNVPPVIPTPTGDTTYLRIDGGNWAELPTFPPTVPNWSVAGAITGSSVTAGIVNSVVFAGSYSSLNVASAACPLGGGCTIEVNNTVTLSANLTLPATTTLKVNQPGIINKSGFNLTVNGPVVAGMYQIFSGSGTVTFGSQINVAPVAWFGATPDGPGGTDDTASIQATLNALTVGQALLQLGTYKTTSALSITRPGIGIKGMSMRITSPTIYANPPASIINSTSASADIVDVSGTGPSATTVYNKFEDFNIERSAVPSGTAAGLSLNYTYGIIIQRVGIQDSIRGIYVHGSGSQGTGYIEDSSVTFGYNGVNETSGSVSGIYLDSADGVANPSFRIRHSFVAANGPVTATTYGLMITGTEINDLMAYGFETATLNYGEYINQTGVGSLITSSDIHLYGTINDGCHTSCIYINGLTDTAGAGVEINGGYATTNGTSPLIDIESSTGVRVIGVQTGIALNTLASACIDVNASSEVALIGNQCEGVRNVGILLNNSTAVAVTGNILKGNASTNGLIALTNSSLNAISANVLTGTGASLVVDSNSNANSGLNTNTIAGTLTAASIAGNNPIFNGVSAWSTGAGAPSGSCQNGSFYSNSLTTTGTYATYQCKNSAWVGIGTAY